MATIRRLFLPENLLLCLTIGIILPFYISGPLLIAIISLLVFHYRHQLWQKIKQTSHWCLFLIYAIIVGFVNGNYIGALAPIAFFIFLLLTLCMREIMTLTLYQRLMKTISLLSGVVSIHAIWTYLKFITHNQYAWTYILTAENPAFRVESFFFNANYFGLFIIMSMLVTLYWLLLQPTKKVISLTLIILLLNSIAIFLTASRMLIPSIIVGFFILLAFHYKKLAFFVGLLGLFILVILLMNPSIFPRFQSLAHGFEDRFTIWKNGAQIFLSRPLTGRGAFAYIRYYYLFSDIAKMHAHNILIDTLANYGLFGLTLLIIACIQWLRSLFNTYQQHKKTPELALIFATLLTVLFHGLMDVSIIWLQTGYIFLLINVGYDLANSQQN